VNVRIPTSIDGTMAILNSQELNLTSYGNSSMVYENLDLKISNLILFLSGL
jgi:hypothetical protein